MDGNNRFKSIVIYITLGIVITLLVYYLPDYYFLKSMVAEHSRHVLSMYGIVVYSNYVNGHIFLGEIEIIRDYTGIQVLAALLGIILPLPLASWTRKGLTLLVLSILLYVANLFRVILEYWLVYNGILPWSLAHYPLSLVLGIVGMFFLVSVADILLPQFGNFINFLFSSKDER